MKRDPKNPLVRGTTMDSLVNTAVKKAIRDRTEEIVDFIRILAEEEQSPGTVYHYMKLAREVSREYLYGQEDDDG